MPVKVKKKKKKKMEWVGEFGRDPFHYAKVELILTITQSELFWSKTILPNLSTD